MRTFKLTFKKNNEFFNLDFEIYNHSAAEKWYSSFSAVSLSEIRQEQELLKSFENSEAKYIAIRDRINELVDVLNTFEGIHIDGYFEDDNQNESLNRLHQHFVATADDQNREYKGRCFSEYNDLIHSMEILLAMMRAKVSRARIMLCFKSGIRHQIDDDEFDLFTRTRRFGDVYVNYPHVGRNPIEIFFSNDINLPDNQVVSQAVISPDTQIYLGDNHLDDPEKLSLFNKRFEEFYETFGAHRWKYSVDDPKLAVGYLPVAKLIYKVSPSIIREKLYGSTLENITFSGSSL